MIYVDTSVALAHLFDEQHRPPQSFWTESLVSSELIEYEVLVRCNARSEDSVTAQRLLARIAMLPLSMPVLGRAREPFPVPVRTLDALHLASADYLRAQHQSVQIATLDRRMRDAARAMSFAIYGE